MNKALAAALVGVLGLALGFGAGYLWDNSRGGDGDPADSPTPTASATPASS
ncbi:hypothetical protein [Demequina phytophila]|uniref:hypothetical protein n=1 Tax=Demequina phytophila TaxID=1638981 RepID=UPI000A8A3F1A|nr:hypothetical protein [Demequina phytophila]